MRVVAEASCLVDARRDGGIGRYACQLIEALSALPDLEIIPAGPRRQPLSESRPSRFLHAQGPLLGATRRVRPHLVHGLGGEAVLGWPAERQVVTVHDVEMWRAPAPPGLRGALLRTHARAMARLLTRCAAIIAVSETTAGEASQELGLDRSRVHVVPHGISSAFSPTPSGRDEVVRAEAGLGRSPYLLWVGSLRHHDPRKGLDTLLEAAGRLPVPRPSLALAGATGPEADRLAHEGRRRGLDITLCGRHDDRGLASLYRGATAVVVPSTHEGFGLPVLEAMACGAPVVGTTAGNIPELAGAAAALVRSRDPQQLAQAIAAVMTSAEVAERLRRAGPRRAASFTWKQSAALTANVYRAVLSGRDESPRPPRGRSGRRSM